MSDSIQTTTADSKKPSRQAFLKGLCLILEGNFAIIGIGYLCYLYDNTLSVKCPITYYDI